MEFSYRVLKAHQNGLNVSTLKHGLDVSTSWMWVVEKLIFY